MARERTLSRLSEMFKRENIGDDRKSNKSISHRYSTYNKQEPTINYSRFGLKKPDPEKRKKISSSFHGNEDPPSIGLPSKQDRTPIMFDELDTLIKSAGIRDTTKRSKSTHNKISKRNKLKEKKKIKIKKGKSSSFSNEDDEDDESGSISRSQKEDSRKKQKLISEEKEDTEEEEEETPVVNRRPLK